MRIAAIDVGSNSVHMIVCRVRPDLSFEVIDREKDMIRVGAGMLADGQLPQTNIDTAMQTLAKYRRLAESHGVDEMIVVGTSAIREPANGGDFIEAARREVGLHVRVISGTEEARLIHLAAAYAIGIGRRAAVVIDMGGGSTEITLGTSARVEIGRSFKLGAIRLTERFATRDPLSPSDERRLVRYIRRETKDFLASIARRRVQRVIGTSGTILALGGLAVGVRGGAADVRRLAVTARDISRLRERLVPMTLDERLKVPGLDPRRADIAAVGAILLDTLLDGLGAETLTLCDFALREGIVLDYIKRNAAHIRTAERYPDVRRRSVIELAERCHYWPAHAQQVARLALQLFDATRDRHALGPRERGWLDFGALVHDIGAHISYESHHKHSYYLVKHGGLRGFDPHEIEIIGLVARYHRQSTPKKSHDGFADLSREQRATVRLLGALVRLAEGLDRSHAQVVTGLSVAEDDTGLIITLHTKGDAELELWAAHRHAEPLSEILETPIRFEAAAPTPASTKDATTHAEHARLAAQLPRTTVRRRGHRRVREDDTARAPG
ncbi:MAG TPA: Ppx/GppA phosphatase family protein [Vicinamibacterales bacterium]|nr:Ppx/GppA phosphatase family protein [Vicinamibacterales bacterium]